MFMRTLYGCVIVFVAAGAAQAGFTDCDCGPYPWNDTCHNRAAIGNCQTGYHYDLQTECEEVCNGPCETNTKTCHVWVTAGNKTKYNVSGSLGVENVFSLDAGWEEETTSEAGCDYTDSCHTESCCVGPAYSYLKYSYAQRYVGEMKSATGEYCRECSENAGVALLKTYANGVCGETEHDEFSPALKTLAQLCAGWGEE